MDLKPKDILLRALPLAGFLVLVLHVFSFPYRLGADQSMYLLAADRFLSGAIPYVDLIDINPPLIIYLNTPLIIASRLSGVSVHYVFLVTILSLIALSSLALYRLLSRSIFSKSETACLIFGLIFLSIGTWSDRGFGQREHLFALALLPYLILRMQRSLHVLKISTFTTFAIGVAAGLASSLKPHFVFVVLLFEGFLHWSNPRQNKKSAEVIGFCIPPVLYALHFLFLPRQEWQAFFTELIPLVERHYSTMGKSPAEFFPHLLEFSGYILISALLITLLWSTLGEGIKFILKGLFVCAIGSLAIYIFHGKDFDYQTIPLRYTAGAIFFLLLPHIQDCGRALPIRRAAAFGIFIVASLALLASLSKKVFHQYFPRPLANAVSDRFWDTNSFVAKTMHSQLVKKDRVIFFTPNPHLMPELVYGDYLNGSRYLFQFPLAFFNDRHSIDSTRPYPYKTFNMMNAEEQRFVRHIKEDVHDLKPKMLIFYSNQFSYSFLPSNFDVLEYFKTNGAWAEWQNDYDLVGVKNNTAVYVRRN